MKKQIKIKRKSIIVFLLFATGILLHLFRITEVPFGINVDEMGMGYDAYCLANFGCDRYMNTYPVYLTNFGGGQSPLYAYICSLYVKIFGLSVITIRLPGILFYLIALVFAVKTVCIIQGSLDKKALIYLLLLVIQPVYILLFRIGMDCNLMLAVGMIFFYFLTRLLYYGRSSDFICFGIISGILLYTYVISYIVLMAFSVVLFVYLIYQRKINLHKLICWVLPLALLAFPLVMVQVINLFDLPEMYWGKVTLTKLPNYRNSEFSLANLSIKSVIRALASVFLFDELRYNSIPEFGNLYYISIPFILIGIYQTFGSALNKLRNHESSHELLYLLWFVIILFVGCCMYANVNRMNGIYFAVTFFCMEGICTVLDGIKNVNYRKIAAVLTAVAYAVSFILFIGFYFGNAYEEKDAPFPYFGYPVEEPLDYALEVSHGGYIYFDEMECTYIYYMGATQISPMEYSKDRGFLTSRYQNIFFGFPNKVNRLGTYIVQKTNHDRCKIMEESGFVGKEFEHYVVYSYPLTDKWGTLENDEIHWNTGVNENNELEVDGCIQEIDGIEQLVLVGWSYDASTDSAWDEILLQVGDEYYMADQVERQDVVELTQDENLLNTGFLFIIPKDQSKVSEADSIKIICLNNENQKTMEIEVSN